MCPDREALRNCWSCAWAVFLKARLAEARGDRVLLINVGEVDWLEAAGKYVCVHACKQSHIIRDTLAHLEARLDPDHFARTHRAAMVNIEPHWHGDYKLILQSAKSCR